MAPLAVVGDVTTTLRAVVESWPLAVAAVLALLGVGIALVAYWWLRTTRGEEFADLLGEWDEAVVLMHPNPDPDAMAVAMGISALGEQFDTEIAINYPGQIRHQENRAFRTVLELDIDPIDHVTELAAENVILVDHNTPRRDSAGGGRRSPSRRGRGRGVHRRANRVRCLFEHRRRILRRDRCRAGAGRPARQRDRERSRVALGGGDRTLVRNSGRHEAVDRWGRGRGFRGCLLSPDNLDRIANPEVDAEVLEVKARAIAGRQTEGSFAVSDVGTVDNADAIPQAADEIIRLEGITAAVVCGEREGTIHLSGRSRDDRVHMGRALEQVTDGISNASAGGHARMGGGQIAPQPQLSDGGEPASEPELPRDRLVDRLFASLSGDV